jgi:hypothetical protein
MASTIIISPRGSRYTAGAAARPRRARLSQALKDKRATPAEIAELIGHEQGFTLSVYAPMQLPLPALQVLIERVKYPGLRLGHLHI